MKEKKISVRFVDNQLDLIESTAKRLCISNSEAVRLFIQKDKIVVIDEFDKMLPVLIKLTMLLEQDKNDRAIYSDLRKGVHEIWQLLNSVTVNQSEE